MKNKKDAFIKKKNNKKITIQIPERETSVIQSTISRSTAKYANWSVTAKKLQTASAGYPIQEPKEIKLNHKLYRIAYIVQQMLAFCSEKLSKEGNSEWLSQIWGFLFVVYTNIQCSFKILT